MFPDRNTPGSNYYDNCQLLIVNSLKVADEQPSLVVVQVHTVSFTIAEHLAVGTGALSCPLAVAIDAETVVPNSHEVVFVDVSLMIVGADARAGRDGTVGKNRGGVDARVAEKQMVAHLTFVVSQETFASEIDPQLPFAATRADEVEQGGKLPVVYLQFRRLVCNSGDWTARPTGKMVKMRQRDTPNCTKKSLNAGRSPKFF